VIYKLDSKIAKIDSDSLRFNISAPVLGTEKAR